MPPSTKVRGAGRKNRWFVLISGAIGKGGASLLSGAFSPGASGIKFGIMPETKQIGLQTNNKRQTFETRRRRPRSTIGISRLRSPREHFMALRLLFGNMTLISSYVKKHRIRWWPQSPTCKSMERPNHVRACYSNNVQVERTKGEREGIKKKNVACPSDVSSLIACMYAHCIQCMI